MSYIVVTVIADGPVPHLYSMVCFGAVIVEPSLSRTFYGRTQPVSEKWLPKDLSNSGFSREQHAEFYDPALVMYEFGRWIELNSKGKPVFISDEPACDWQWINWYFHRYLGHNPFGYVARRIGDLYCGMKMDAGLNTEWKKLFRRTKKETNPVHIAKESAGALLALQAMGLLIQTQ